MDYITEAIESFEKKDSLEDIVSHIYSQSDTFHPASWDSWQSGKEYVGISGSYFVAINMTVRLIVMPTQTQPEVTPSSLFHNIVSNLLHNRDFLGYQLSFYKGNLTEDKFNIIKDKYLTPHHIYDTSALAHSVLLLMKSTSLIFDADKISAIFNCDVDVAEEALTEIISILNA